MTSPFPIGQTLRIRDCGFDENWLHDQIIANPSCLGLGDLEVVSHERQQSSGGRLDLLLKDTLDDSMYETEIMLGDTDESHIIRTIEYWDNEKRRWPQREHFAVLVAESITRRFFNVIQLLSQSIPIIAIQVNIVAADDKKILNFFKVLDTYEEPEDSTTMSNEPHDEDYWRNKAPWTIDAAKSLLDIVAPVYGGASLNFVKTCIAVIVNNHNYFWLNKRSGNKSLLGFWVGENLLSQAASVLDAGDVSYVKKTQSIRITVDKQMIQANGEMFKEIAKLVKQGWAS